MNNFQALNPDDPRLAGPWELVAEQGWESQTWISDQWVLQRRPNILLVNISKAQIVLQPLAQQLAFCAAQGQVVGTAEDSFYYLTPRIAGQRLPQPQEGQEFEAWPEVEKFLAPLAEALAALQRQPITAASYCYPRNPLLSAQLASRQWVLSALEHKLGEKVLLPSEPQAELRLAHGDLNTANCLTVAGQVALIDWGNLGPLPAYSDGAQLTQSLLVELPVDFWPEVLAATNILVPELSYQQWVRVVINSLARNAAVLPEERPGREGVLRQLPDILGFLDQG